MLDTNVLIALMRDPSGAVALSYRAKLKQPAHFKVATSVVVQCELQYRLAKRPTARLQSACDLVMAHLPVLALDEHVPPHCAHLRAALELAGTPIGHNDALIAAHALAACRA